MKTLLCAAIIGVVFLIAGPAQAVVYVSPTGNDANGGTSWADAKATLQAGIDLAAQRAHNPWAYLRQEKVYVRWGTYYETVKLTSFVALVGGFLGQGQTRDWRKYPTVIDAWFSGSAVTVTGTYGWAGPGSNTQIDGFTIKHGYAEYGGGVFLSDDWHSLLIKNCQLTENVASCGGAVGSPYADFDGSVKILNSYLTNNSAALGGAVHLNANNIWTSGLTAANSLFADNEAGAGGAIFARKLTTELTNCTFARNSADVGGAIYWTWGDLGAGNSLFAENDASWGGVVYTDKSYIGGFANCCFHNNGSDPFHRANIFPGPTDNNPVGKNGNFDANPMFLSPEHGDYHLWFQPYLESPCVDAGNSTLLDPTWTTDLDGNPRVVGKVDVGCYEIQH